MAFPSRTILASILILGAGVVAHAADDDKDALAKQAGRILKTHCYRCHGQDGTAEGGFNYVLEPQRLAPRNMIALGRADQSRLYQRVNRGEMPPEEETVRLSNDDIAILKRWINSGAADFNPPRPKRPFIASTDMIESMCNDLATLDAPRRPRTRYFTITHLYNAGLSEDELQTYRHGLAKLVNSLSWGEKIVVPSAIDAEKTILRIDLHDYKWTDKMWESVLAAYPYPTAHPGDAALYCQAATNCKLPHVRADWFVNAASHPPLYYDILDMPKRFWDLQVKLDALWNSSKPEEQKHPLRAGFNNSGVSRNNRLIERWVSRDGALWRTFDFATNTGKQNLFAHPTTFRHDGGEVLFNLPNGLQAYMIVNADDMREDRSPKDIVTDPKRPDRSLEAGISCMSCHVRGTIEKSDQILAHLESNAETLKFEAQKIREMHIGQARLKELLEGDAGRFQRAVRQTGASMAATEPIVALAQRFDAELNLELAAAEAGMKPEEFTAHCKRSAKLALMLGPLLTQNATVKREVFSETFPLLREENVPVRQAPKASPELTTPRRMHPGDWVLSVGFTPDGARAMSSMRSGRVQLWDLATGKEVRFVEPRPPTWRRIAVCPDGNRFLEWDAIGGAGGSGLSMWDMQARKEALRYCKEPVFCVAVSPDGKRLLSGETGGIRLWELDTGKELRRFGTRRGDTECIAYSADGRQALSDGEKNVLRLWDVETGKEIRTFEGHSDRPKSVALSPDGRMAVSSGTDKSIRLWDVETGKQIRTLGGTEGPYQTDSVCFTPDSARVLSGGTDGRVRLWDVKTSLEVRTVRLDALRHTQPIWCVACSAERSLCPFGSHGRRIDIVEADEVMKVDGTDVRSQLCELMANYESELPTGIRHRGPSGPASCLLHGARCMEPVSKIMTANRSRTLSTSPLTPCCKIIRSASSPPTIRGPWQPWSRRKPASPACSCKARRVISPPIPARSWDRRSSARQWERRLWP